MKRCWFLRALILLYLVRPAMAQNQVLSLDRDGDFVRLPGHIFGHLAEATVEAWARWEDWALFSQVFAFGADGKWRAMGVNHAAESPVLQFFLYADKDHLRVLPVATDLPLGQWCHVAAVSGLGGMRFYLNGVLVGENPYQGSLSAIGPDEDNYLGKSNWKENAFFHGQLDEVRVWAVARSAEQIRATMHQVLSGSEQGLVGLWSFDAGDARDLSPLGHHGQMLGGARCVAEPFPGAEAAREPALVEGRVSDDAGPVGGVVVRLRKGEAERVRMTTGQDGRYRMAVFGEGTYSLDAWLGEVGIEEQEVALEGGETRHLDLALDLDPPGPPPGRVAFWPGEGDARDTLGHRDGTLVNGATFAPGLVGQAFSFEGQGSYVDLPPEVADFGRADFTIDLWMRQSGRPGRQPRPLFIKRPDGLHFVNLAVAPSGRTGAELRNGDNLRFLQGNLNLRTQVWHHVALTRQGAVIRLYTDGRLESQTSTEEVIDLVFPGPLALGASLPYQLYYEGLIDEVSIHDRALSDTEVQRLYSASAVALWPGEGNADDTRGGNDGTLVNGVSFAPGLVGQAFSFDGQGSYVEFNPYIGDFGTADFAIELWLWRASTQSAPAPILFKRINDQNLIDLHLDEAGQVQVELRSPNNVNRFGSNRRFSARAWHHLALVRQGKKVGLYLDGQLDTLSSTERVVALAAPMPMTLGASLLQDLCYQGLIDEVSIHNRALSVDEIQGIYDADLGAWRRTTWIGRLERGGIGLLVVVAVLSSARYYAQRRESRHLRELLLMEERRARSAAEDANQAKSVFLANMSHEIRTPMNSILGYARILRDHTALSTEQRRAVETIHASGDHLLGLIDEVLDLSKIEAGRMELQPVDFDLARLLEGLAGMFRQRCQEKGLGWRVEREGEGWQVRADEIKLRQVLINLLGNAVKFTDAGQVVLRVEVKGGLYSFEVQDTGPGIPPRQQEAVFEPFQQWVSGGWKGGTGLGLAIARRHVELMGGHLRLDSAPGRGSRFFFRLRLDPAQLPAAGKALTGHGQVVRLAAGPAPCLLIVDDVLANREILAQVLEWIGARVRQADSGEAALEAMRRERPDLVFMDIRMPGMGGLEALRQIRRDHGPLPVAAISASVLEHERQYYLQSGFDAFLDKPFRLEHIYACLERLLGVRYEYTEPLPNGTQPPADFDGLPLPAPLRARLRHAAEMHNVTEVRKCLDQMQGLGTGEHHLAAHLGELARRYDMDTLLRVLAETADG